MSSENKERATDAGCGNLRGRPGRRSAAEKREDVLNLLALQYGVHSDTVVAWRDAALLDVGAGDAAGAGATPRERELEREQVDQPKLAVQGLSVGRALAVQAIEEWKRSSRITRPVRLRR